MGVINGYWNEDAQAYLDFGPDDAVTREQLAAMLTNYAEQVAGIETETYCLALDDMPDADDVDLWARDSVGWAMDMELISGTVEADGAYVRPLATAQRCAMAKMASVLHRDVLPPEVEDNATPVVEYADGVITVSESGSSISSDGLTVSVPTSSLNEKVTEGSIVAVSDDGVSGTAIKAESVIEDGNRTIISGSQPDISEVYERFSIQDIVNTNEMSLALEDGFELVEEETAGDESLASNIGDSLSLGTINFKIKVGEHEFSDADDKNNPVKVKATVTGNATLSIEPSLVYKIDYGNKSLNDAYFAIKAACSIKGDVSFSVSGKFKIARLSAGIAGADVYLIVDANGTVSIQLSESYMAGYRYSSHKLKNFEKLNQSDLSLSVAASMRVGLGAIGDLRILCFTLADCGPSSGVAGEWQVTEHPALECKNLSAYLFLTIDYGQTGLMKELGLSGKRNFFTAKTSPLRKSWHWEDDELVDKCTWNSKVQTTEDGYKYVIAKDVEGWNEGETFITYKDCDLTYYGEGAYILNYEGDSDSIRPPAYIDRQPVLSVAIQNEGIKTLDMTDCGKTIQAAQGETINLVSYIDHSQRSGDKYWTTHFDYEPMLRTIDMSGSSICGLYLGNLPRLTTVNVSNSNINEIWGLDRTQYWNKKEGTKLEIPRLTTLNVASCDKLEALGLWKGNLRNLDLSTNEALVRISLKDCQIENLKLPTGDNLYEINIEGNNLTAFNQEWLTGNPGLIYINCSYNKILDVSNIESWVDEEPIHRFATTQPQNINAETASLTDESDDDSIEDSSDYTGPSGCSFASGSKSSRLTGQ